MVLDGETDPVQQFLHAVLSARIDACRAWSDRCVLDATVPNWRFRRSGPQAIRQEYQRWFADPGQFDELDRRAVDGLEVVRYVLAWTENGVPHAAHHMHWLRVVDGLIVSDTVFCGGRWPAALLADMEAAGA